MYVIMLTPTMLVPWTPHREGLRVHPPHLWLEDLELGGRRTASTKLLHQQHNSRRATKTPQLFASICAFRNVPRKINRYSASAMLFALLSFLWPLVMESGVRDTQAGYIAQQL
jgi:hypothetical protein